MGVLQPLPFLPARRSIALRVMIEANSYAYMPIIKARNRNHVSEGDVIDEGVRRI